MDLKRGGNTEGGKSNMPDSKKMYDKPQCGFNEYEDRARGEALEPTGWGWVYIGPIAGAPKPPNVAPAAKPLAGAALKKLQAQAEKNARAKAKDEIAFISESKCPSRCKKKVDLDSNFFDEPYSVGKPRLRLEDSPEVKFFIGKPPNLIAMVRGRLAQLQLSSTNRFTSMIRSSVPSFFVALALVTIFAPQSFAQTPGRDALMEDGAYRCLKGKFPNVRRDLHDHTRAFDPDSGRNFAWEKDKGWIDVKTGQSICPPKPAYVEDGAYRCLKGKFPNVRRDLHDHTRAFDPDSGRNFA